MIIHKYKFETFAVEIKNDMLEWYRVVTFEG